MCSGLPRSEKKFREKSGNFVDGQGNLERTWKVREKSGNLKINGYGIKAGFRKFFILFKREKDVLLSFLGEQILSFKSNPQI